MRFVASFLVLVALIAALVSAAPGCGTDEECLQLRRLRRRTLRLRPRNSPTPPPTCKANGEACQLTPPSPPVMPPGMGPVNGGPGGMGPPDGGPNPMGPSPPDVKGGCCNVCSVAQGPNAPMNMSGTCKTCVKNDDLCSTKDDCCSKNCMGGKCSKK